MSEEAATAPRFRSMLIVELCLMLALSWLPHLLTNLARIAEDRYPSYKMVGVASTALWFVDAIGPIALVIFILARSGSKLSDYGFRMPKPVDLLAGFGLFVALFMIRVGTAEVLFHFKHLPGANRPTGLGFNAIPWVGVRVAYVFAAATHEETYYRGYLLGRLEDLQMSPAMAVLLSSVMFGINHIYEGWIGSLMAFEVGVVFSIVMLRYRSIWPVSFAHFLTNFSILFPFR